MDFSNIEAGKLELVYSPSKVRFTVIDSGIGMPPEVLAKLFQPFTQGDSSTTRQFGGTGLGLSICKRLVTQMDGDISVESKVGKGSLFTFTLPLLVRSEANLEPPRRACAAPVVAPSRQVGLRVRVAEDNAVNRKITAKMLERLGCKAVFATDSFQAVSLSRQEAFDVILMDCLMPGMDGFHAAAEIQSGPVLQDIIGMTASALTGDKQRALQAGMTDYMTKPFTEQECSRY